MKPIVRPAFPQWSPKTIDPMRAINDARNLRMTLRSKQKQQQEKK